MASVSFGLKAGTCETTQGYDTFSKLLKRAISCNHSLESRSTAASLLGQIIH